MENKIKEFYSLFLCIKGNLLFEMKVFYFNNLVVKLSNPLLVYSFHIKNTPQIWASDNESTA